MIDVYSGCPLYVFIYIVILPKIAVLYVFFCFMVSIAYYSIGILTIMQILLLFSMGLGVMGALFQTQIRRIIAFSGMVNISYIV
jgi:NADH-quinone oxidoreductase subunit N